MLVRLVVFPVAFGPVTFADGQNRFERFIRLFLPKFRGAIEDDYYVFFINCHKRFHKLYVIDSHGVD